MMVPLSFCLLATGEVKDDTVIGNDITTLAQGTVTELKVKDHSGVGEDLADAGAAEGPTLIDILYSTPSDGIPVDQAVSKGGGKRKVVNREQYLYRRTVKVC